MRVRCFTQDDAHIFMTEAQIENEIQKVVKLIDEVYKKFGFTYHVELSTRPDDSMGTEEEWEVATNALENAIKAMNIPYEVNEETAHSMVQNLTSIYRILSEEHGSAEQSSLTSSFHRDLRQNILEQTEKNIVQS